jgi:photosystem II stability/assembly factor-like uncharacterized protein
MAISLSHGGTTTYSSSSRSDQVLVGTIEGVVTIERDAEGSGWHVAHRGLTDKHVHAIVIEPDSGTIFAGASHGSFHASTDGGHTWEQRDNGLTENDIYSLALARVNGGARIYAGTEPAHLFYSDDLGHHWTDLPALRSVDTSRWTFPAPPNIAHTKYVTFHPNDSNTVFVGIEQGGFLKTTDSGQTFHAIVGMDDDVHRIAVDPHHPERIYVATGFGMFVTLDGGDTWEQRTAQGHQIGSYPDTMVFHPRLPDLMFVGSAKDGPGSWRENNFAGSRISKSADGGRTWETLGHGLPDRLQSAFEAMTLEDWGESCSLFAATATGEVWCSDNAGESWSEIFADLAPVSKGTHYQLKERKKIMG